MTSLASLPDRSYDLFLVAGGRRFFFRNDNHGVTLKGEGLAWTADGRADAAPYANIAEVRLRSGGDWKNAVNQCQIRFRDGYLLTLLDADAFGRADEDKTPIYRAFVRDLHNRIDGAGLTRSIAFIAGYTESQFTIVLICALLLGLAAVLGPVILLVMTGKMEMLLTLAGSAVLIWPLWRMVSNNAPRRYNPASPPGELME